ncbi:hypothetical protein MMC24_000287 [Lignoscripta atroalba]|nr:hypothetical protein [Lignoscripta atroalba]
MAKFTVCPNEITSTIFSHTPSEGLLAFSYTCRSLRRLAQPVLYREIRWTWDRVSEHNPRIHLLLRSLLENPELASYIEHIDFQGSKPRSIWLQHNHPDLPDTDMRLLESLVDIAQFPSALEWRHMLEYGQLDAFLALLLSQTFNLKSLELGFEFQYESKYIGIMLKHALFPSGATFNISNFKRLKRVAFCTKEIVGGRHNLSAPEYPYPLPRCPPDFDQITPFFYLPSIRSITLWIQNPSRLTWPSERPWAMALTTLIVHHSEAYVETLEQLLSGTPNLKVLEYRYHGCTQGYFHNEIPTFLECEKLSQALDHVKGTIQRIIISIDFYATVGDELEWGGRHWGIKGTLNSMMQFEKLESLTVPMVMLLGWSPSSMVKLADCLPQSMRELYITDDLVFFDRWQWTEQDYLDRFHEYLYDWKSSTSSLSYIGLQLSSSCWKRHSLLRLENLDQGESFVDRNRRAKQMVEQTHQALEAMCGNAGVECNVIDVGT